MLASTQAIEVVSHKRLAAALACNFNVSYSVITGVNHGRDANKSYYDTKRLVFHAADSDTSWIFLLQQDGSTDEVQTMHVFKRTHEDLKHAKILCTGGTLRAPEIDYVTKFSEPILVPTTNKELVSLYTAVNNEIGLPHLSRADTFYASSELVDVERPVDVNQVSLFFKSENTTFHTRNYKILLMRVRNEEAQRDDVVVACFHAMLQGKEALLSPVFKDVMRLYHKRAYSEMLNLIGEAENPWVYSVDTYPYPDEPHCFCWTTPKTRIKVPAEPGSKRDFDNKDIQDERFQPFVIYKVHKLHYDAGGYITSVDVVSADGEIVNHRPHHFVTIPGKTEHVKRD